MRKIMAAASIAALIIIVSVALPTFAGERSPWHAVAYPLSLALFIPYVYLTLPAIMDDRRGMTALYSLFVFLAIILIFAISELSGRGSGRMRLLVLEGALLCMMALSFASFLISLGITETVILAAPLMAAAMIYIMAAVVDIVPPEGVGAVQAAGNAGQAPIPSYPAEAAADITADEVPAEETEELQAMMIESDECLSSIPAIVVPDEAIPETAMPIVLPEGECMEAAGISSQPEISEDETVAAIYAEAEEYRTEVDGISMEISSYETVPAAAGDIDEACEEVDAITFSDESSTDSEPAVALSDDIAFESVEAETAEDTAEGEEISAISSQASYDDVIIAASQIEDGSASEPVQTPADSVAPEYEAVEASAIEEEVPPADAETEATEYNVPEPPVIHASAILSVPSAPVLSNTAKLEGPVVPEVPVLTSRAEIERPSAPIITNRAELVEKNTSELDVFNGLTPEEVDFWSTFYIAGQDNLVLDDGVYYMDLYINDTFTGTVQTIVQDSQVSLLSSELEGYLRNTITAEAFDRIFSYGGNQISLEYLDDIGIRTSFNSDSYEVRLYFTPDDMPVQILSISGRSGSRRRSRPVVGGIDLTPAVFTLESSYNLTGRVADFTSANWWNSMRFTFSSSNYARLYDLHFDFNYYLRFGLHDFSFDFGTYKFYYDFPEQMIRLSVGNVSSDLLSPDGISVGLEFEKSYSYADSDYIRPSQYEEVLVIEKPSDVEIFNEGRQIFRRTLDVGTYRLRDFILYTGVNRITVRVSPLDGSPSSEIDIDLMYSGSLLAPGEIYYGASLVTGRREVSSSSAKADSAFRIPLWSGRSLEYDFRNVVFSSFVRAGLSETLTLDTTLALQNRPTSYAGFRPNARIAAELTHANILGTTRYILNVSEYSDSYGKWQIPGFYAGIGHQFMTGWTGLSSINLNGYYYSPGEVGIADRHRIALSGGMSGRFGMMNWSLNASGAIYSDSLPDSYWYLSTTLNFSLTRNIWLTASANISGTGDDSPSFGGRVSATIRFGGSNATVTVSDTNSYASYRYTGGKHTFSVNADTYDLTDFGRYGFDADYSYSGDVFYTTLGLDAGSSFDRIGADFRVSTASVFADGLLAFNSYIPSNYILISQKGALKGNDVSIGVPGSSSLDPLDSLFGVSMYEGLSSGNYDESFIVYSEGGSQFAPVGMFPVNIKADRNGGYVLRMDAPNTYAASGIVYMPSGEPWLNGSSPIYSVSIEDGRAVLQQTDEYIFTDSDGRFVTQTLEPGMYGFDVMTEEGWILYLFSVDDIPSSVGDVQMMNQSGYLSGIVIDDIYSAAITFSFDRVLSGDEFFNLLYGGVA